MSAAFIRSLSLLAAIAAPTFAFSQAKPAAPAPAPAAAAAEPQISGVPMPWVKLCDKVPFEEGKPESVRQVCLIAQEARAENGQILATAQIREIEKDPKKAIIIAVPVGMLLQPGIRVGIDKHEPISMRYEACVPNACFAQAELTDETLKKMKAGNMLQIQVVNMNNRAVSLNLSLKDFGKVFDGPALDPKQNEDNQKKLGEELQKRAEEQRKNLKQ
jgi:invasion protein IalB